MPIVYLDDSRYDCGTQSSRRGRISTGTYALFDAQPFARGTNSTVRGLRKQKWRVAQEVESASLRKALYEADGHDPIEKARPPYIQVT